MKSIGRKKVAINEVFPGVFQLDNFIDLAIGNLLTEISAEMQAKTKYGPNTMNKYGAVFTGGLRTVCRHLAFPALEHCFPGVKFRRDPYVMTVSYEMKKQRSLSSHTDQSEFTFNGCLSGKFTGGELVVYDGDKRKVLEQQQGRVFVHRGDVVHRAMPIRSGARTNLVLWCESV